MSEPSSIAAAEYAKAATKLCKDLHKAAESFMGFAHAAHSWRGQQQPDENASTAAGAATDAMNEFTVAMKRVLDAKLNEYPAPVEDSGHQPLVRDLGHSAWTIKCVGDEAGRAMAQSAAIVREEG